MKLKALQGIPCNTTKAELENILANLPMRRFSKLTHVGRRGQQGTSSQEGPLLSASEFPESWRRIARIGGTEWKIRRKSGNLTLIHMLGKGAKRDLESWGLKTGLAHKEDWWWTPTSTDENGAPLFCWCKSKAEADAEHDPETGENPRKKTVIVPGKALWEIWHQRHKTQGEPTPWYAASALATNLVILAGQTLGVNHPLCPDGLFWNELHEPASLSAPRMGINPHAELDITP